MQKGFGFFILFFGLAGNTFGQRGDTIVLGTVKDSRTKKLIENAAIELTGINGSYVIKTTKENGEYFILKADIKDWDSYQISCSKKPAYLPSRSAIKLNDSLGKYPITVNFEIEPAGTGCNFYPIFSFKKNNWEISEENMVLLTDLEEMMKYQTNIVMEVGGHADYTENNPAKLSEKRAQAIINVFVNRGIDPGRLVLVAYGSSESYKIHFDEEVFKAGDVLDKEYVSKLKDLKIIEESIRLNGAASFKILGSDYKPKN